MGYTLKTPYEKKTHNIVKYGEHIQKPIRNNPTKNVKYGVHLQIPLRKKKPQKM